MKHSLTWVEISRNNLEHNVRSFKKIIGSERLLAPAVKANAYGHGLKQCAPIMAEAGADWLCVNSLFEAVDLQEIGIKIPIYIMGHIALHELEEAVNRGFNMVVYNSETLSRLVKIVSRTGLSAKTHLKLETGNNRQGVREEQLAEIAGYYRETPQLKLVGAATHFANIEDTTDHHYADNQLEKFRTMIKKLEEYGCSPIYRHCANTAATILFPDTYLNMVRTGIGSFGLWPSTETMLSAKHLHKMIELKPVMTWKTRIAQVKKVPAGEFIGYGCTYRTPRETQLAILPIGYYDGYDRKLSNKAYVLIKGQRAPIRGRVCMNIAMADITDISGVTLEDEVVLIGSQQDETISAETFAKWADTINYEATTRINERIERVLI